jgi:hypothetical protein
VDKTLLVVGLAFNTVGALVLLLPTLNPWKEISNDLIVGSKNEEKEEESQYIQIKDLKNMISGIAGFIFLLVGFILQLIGTVVS